MMAAVGGRGLASLPLPFPQPTGSFPLTSSCSEGSSVEGAGFLDSGSLPRAQQGSEWRAQEHGATPHLASPCVHQVQESVLGVYTSHSWGAKREDRARSVPSQTRGQCPTRHCFFGEIPALRTASALAEGLEDEKLHEENGEPLQGRGQRAKGVLCGNSL